MFKVLCVGPRLHPLTGQSYAFNSYVKNTKLKVDILYSSGGNKYVVSSIYFVKLICKYLLNSYDSIYFTSSRTKVGFFRDLFLVFLFSRKCKLINHLHGSDFIDFRESSGFLFQGLIDFVYNRITHSIVLTEGMKEQYSSYKSMEVSVIPNFYEDCNVGVDHGRLESLGKESYRVLYLSNLIPDKGLVELVEAIKILNLKHGFNVNLSIVGASLDYYELDNYVEKSSAQYEFISFLGPLYGDEKAQCLSDNHFFILPSYYKTEAQPISIIEAMANGCVIITTNHNYLPELISEKNGSLVKVRDVESIVLSLVKYFNNCVQIAAISNYNKQDAVQRFSIEKYINSLDSVVSLN
jgi:glycosyltransferase involved in cell wall biosynthesis